MDVGAMMVFASYGWENCPDGRVWDEEIRLARIAADSGFDCLWHGQIGQDTAGSCVLVERL
jgi:hypothetical protein